MSKIIDLTQHISMTSATKMEKIVSPLKMHLGIKMFRYLKLYKNGKRVVLTNIPDAIRYIYEEGNYVDMWFDGGFTEFFKEGWQSKCINELIDKREVGKKITDDLETILGLDNGVGFVQEGDGYFEFFLFESNNRDLYSINKQLLLRFINYFRKEARKLLINAEKESIIFPMNTVELSRKNEKIDTYLSEIKSNRHYLGGKHKDAYLTSKEIACVRWMIEGKTADEIAIIESINIKTVHRHIENIKLKFNCHKQTQIIRLILESGLIG